MKSIWKKSESIGQFKPIKNDVKTDVLIIGGGMAGILCGYMLKNAGIDCIVAEADRICSGITKNTTAKITSQHGMIYDKMLNHFGTEKTKMYLQSNEMALEKYKNICKNIDCDFEIKDAYAYSLDNREKVEKEVAALNKIGFNAQFCEKLALPFPVAGAVQFKNQAQFNPIKFIGAISKNLPIHEHTKVLELAGTSAICEDGTITAQKIIVATHFPFLNKHGSYFLKMYQHRSYVIAYENAPDLNGMYIDEDKKGLSFRNYNGMLLIGGGSHRTGKSGGNYTEIEDFAKRYYPKSHEVTRFATQDCMTLDSIPYIGKYSANTENLYVATGFNKWGMTSSLVAALLLCDIVKGKKNPWSELYSPSRTIIRPQLAINAAEAVTNLLTPTAPRCPHLGCALKWNRDERSWDCSCHGSRFNKNGKLIDNPATGDLQKNSIKRK